MPQVWTSLEILCSLNRLSVSRNFQGSECKCGMPYSKLSLLLSELEIGGGRRRRAWSQVIFIGFIYILFKVFWVAQGVLSLATREYFAVKAVNILSLSLSSCPFPSSSHFFFKPSYLITHISSGWGEPILIRSSALYCRSGLLKTNDSSSQKKIS